MKFFIHLVFAVLLLVPLTSATPWEDDRFSSRLLPVLPYIFFDTNSSALSGRYVQYPHPARGAWFKEESIEVVQQIQQNYLNILGLRMTDNPATTITLRGQISGENPQESQTSLATARAMKVKNYLVHSWEIDPARITIDSLNYRKPSVPKHSDEFRRVTVSTNDWELQKPIPVTFKNTPTKPESFLLFDFKYASDDMGNLNRRVIRDYIVPRIAEGMKVTINAYIDQAEVVAGNKRDFTERRATAVRDEIKKHAKVKDYTITADVSRELMVASIGNIAETNFICRRVEVIIERP